MTAHDLVRGQIDNAGFQLTKTLEAVREDQLDTKPIPSTRSVREQVEHLCEVYFAASKIAIGEQYDWGTYKPEAESWTDLIALMWSLRARATDACLTADNDKGLHTASDYIVEHDSYHIGQLATLRIFLDSDWDPYSLYR